MKEFIQKMFSTGDEVSSKRVIGFLAFFLIAIVTFVDLFTTLSVSEYVFDGLMWIVLGVFLASALDKFSLRRGINPLTRVNVEKVENLEVSADSKVLPKTVQKLADNEIIG